MAPEDIQGDTQEQAAQSLSRILTEAGVDHAFIGGLRQKSWDPIVLQLTLMSRLPIEFVHFLYRKTIAFLLNI